MPIRRFNIFRKTHYGASNVYRWYRSSTQINAEVSSCIRLSGTERKLLLGDLEEVIYDETFGLRISNIKVTRKFIRKRSPHLAIGINLDFVASAHWVNNFMDRNKLAFRRATNLTLLSDKELIQRAVNFMNCLCKMKLTCNPATTIIMDETAVYMEDATHNGFTI